MIWAGISTNQETALHVLWWPLALPFLAEQRLRLLQQDNARPHGARLTMDFLRQKHVNTLPLNQELQAIPQCIIRRYVQADA